MKKLLLGIAGVIALAAPASAADLAARPYAKAPAMIAAVYDWSGFYIGANGGWGSSRKCWDAQTAAGVFIASEGCHNATGGVAGGQLGYRWQTGSWVFGVEGQGDWADLKGRNISLANAGFTNESTIGAFGLLTGQIGYIASTAEFTPKTVQTDELRTALVYEVRVYVDDTDNVLRLGMPATVRLEV